MSDKVSITRSKLEELVRDSLRLEALDQAGVDNWQGYDEVDRELYSELSVQETVDYILGDK